MGLIILLFCVNILALSINADDPTCSNGRKNLGPARLKTHLLCDYDKSLRPVLSTENATSVVVRMILKSFAFDMHTNTFTVNNWLALYWKDQHLTWTPSDFDSIKTIHLSTNDIWVPDFSIYNKNDQSGNVGVVGSVECLVYAEGTVVCVPPTRQEALCVADVSKFPFDVQTCTVRYGSWVNNGEEIDFTIPKNAVSREDYEPNGNWDLISTNVTKNPGHYSCCPNNTYPSLSYTFIFKRHSGLHTATVFIPALVMAVITLTILWTDPKSVERLCLSGFNILIHMMYVQYIFWQVPVNGDKTPLIVLFARDALLLSAFALVLGVILRNLLSSNSSSPSWMTTTVTSIVQSLPAKLILYNYSVMETESMKKDELSANIIEEQTSNSQNRKDWLLFAKALDRLTFVAYFLTYIIMFIAFIP